MQHRGSAAYAVSLDLLALIIRGNVFKDTRHLSLALGRKVITIELKAIHSTLSAGHNAKIMAAFRLLAAVAGSSEACASELYHALHMSTVCALSQRRQKRGAGGNAEKNVRTFYVLSLIHI